MRTRIMILIAVIGIGVVWIGASQGLKYVTIAGIAFLLIGLIGGHFAVRNKRGLGFLKRL
jgi:hypothetical protein